MWRVVGDPRTRLARALDEVGAWHERSGAEFLRIVADAPRVPAMRDQAAEHARLMRERVAVLTRGWGARGRRAARLRTAVAHALQPATWRSLMDEGGLSRAEAAALLLALAKAAAGGGRAVAAPPADPRDP